MQHTITHQTTFEFDEVQGAVVQRFHLTPVNGTGQVVREWQLDVDGGSIELETTDFHGNHIHLCRLDTQAKSITITCRGSVVVEDLNGIAGPHEGHIPLPMFCQPTRLSRMGPRLRDLFHKIDDWRYDEMVSDPALMHHLSACVHDSIRYEIGITDVTTTAEQAMERGAGVCQDHAHAFISIARSIGFPARYASGYLMMDDTPLQQASHAWAEVYLSGLGWVGFDISNGISPDHRYIKLATGFDYADVSPVSGVRFGDGGEQVSTSIVFEQQ